MNVRERFKEAVRGRRHGPGREAAEGELDELAPGLPEGDALLIARAMRRATFEGVEFYGPGAQAADDRRRAALALDAPKETTPEPAAAEPEAPEKKKRQRLSKAERLERKAAKLRAEIEALKK
ncbi:MAG: hypothetical protein ABSG19_13730 [Candidatus Aminicenantales bacterium]